MTHLQNWSYFNGFSWQIGRSPCRMSRRLGERCSLGGGIAAPTANTGGQSVVFLAEGTEFGAKVDRGLSAFAFYYHDADR
jgi:hypothetical protein